MPFTATMRPARRAVARGEERGLLLERRGLTGLEGDPGPAHRARHRLGVEAAASGILVLGAAGRAEGELGHRRPRAVVGEMADDGVAGPAVGAVDERIAVPPIGGISISRRHASQVATSGGTIARPDARPALWTMTNSRSPRGSSGRTSSRSMRRVAAEIAPEHVDEAVDRFRIAFHLNPHAVRVVAHQPGETEPARDPVHGGRNPTPCTAPEIRTPDRASVSATDRPDMVLAVCARDTLAVKRADWRQRHGLSDGGQRRLCSSALVGCPFSLSSLRHVAEAYVHCAQASPYRARWRPAPPPGRAWSAEAHGSRLAPLQRRGPAPGTEGARSMAAKPT